MEVQLSNKHTSPCLVKAGSFPRVAGGVRKGIATDALSHGEKNDLQEKDMANTGHCSFRLSHRKPYWQQDRQTDPGLRGLRV